MAVILGKLEQLFHIFNNLFQLDDFLSQLPVSFDEHVQHLTVRHAGSHCLIRFEGTRDEQTSSNVSESVRLLLLAHCVKNCFRTKVRRLDELCLLEQIHYLLGDFLLQLCE